MAEQKSITTTTRLPPEMRARLDDLVAKRGVNVAEYLREVIESHLDDAPDVRLRETVEGLHDELRRLREQTARLRRDVALSLEAILLNLVDDEDKDQVVAYVQKHLRDRPPDD